MTKIKMGIIEAGGLKGKKIILEPRNGLKRNEYLIEKGIFFNGAPMFAKYCLICEIPIPDNGCLNCNGEEYQNVSL